MKKFLAIAVVLIPIAAPAAHADECLKPCGLGTSFTKAVACIPSYELAGFPISPHQWSVLGSANIKEQSPSPSLTMAGMPASAHQIAVLTPRVRPIVEGLAAK